jgi:hypothetical protein
MSERPGPVGMLGMIGSLVMGATIGKKKGKKSGFWAL